MRVQACFPYVIVVTVVMSLYSVFLLHLSSPFRPSPHGAAGYPSETVSDRLGNSQEQSCVCTQKSEEGLKEGTQVVMGLSFPYRYFDSNHWFHISEYYVSRHTHVAPQLPKNATVYIVAPYDLFVAKLIPMTFFLLLLAFTDGTTRIAEVLSKGAIAQMVEEGEVLALDTTAVESYVYDSSLPAFNRTRKYEAGERRAYSLSRGWGDAGNARYLRMSAEGAISVVDAQRQTGRLPGRHEPRTAITRRRSRRRLTSSQRRRRQSNASPDEVPTAALQEAESPGARLTSVSVDARDRTGEEGSSAQRECECAHYVGEFGAAPVERGYWFQEETVTSARLRIDALCGDIYRRRQRERSAISEQDRRSNDSHSDGTPGTAREQERKGHNGGVDGNLPQRLVIYQRDYDRRLLKLDDVMGKLRELLGPDWELKTIVHSNSHEPCWLYSELMDADMLVTPHGFQSMLLLFLPPGAVIVEIFPYKYWKEGYAPLAEEWGVYHKHVMSHPISWLKGMALFFIPLDRCMRSIKCRKWSRGADVRLEERHLRQIAAAAQASSKRKQEFLPQIKSEPNDDR